MNSRILRRYVTIGIVALLVTPLVVLLADYFDRPPGDYETEQGQIHLNADEFEEALEDFDRALEVQPDHRGALMGRAIVFMETDRPGQAEAEFDYLIEFLERTLEPEDTTGRGTLAAAYANRGILLDRQGRYEEALASYVRAIEVDEGAIEGPGLGHRILFNARPSTVRDRAIYLAEQLQLPEEERLMRVPEIDAEQRRHRP
jgi:tetratricopeptide (TPR) repeat protein